MGLSYFITQTMLLIIVQLFMEIVFVFYIYINILDRMQVEDKS